MPSLAVRPETSSPRPDSPEAELVNGLRPNGNHDGLNKTHETALLLELDDGSSHRGYSFGARKSVAGELVFQTGMVGYPESVTDPSYRGQILVMTFPLVGNYGVPSRDIRDAVIETLPAHFEASEIHIAGLVVTSYSGEDYSHHLATSSLGTWLKEQGVPAMYGVDTRALTKKIREKGSMLGRLRISSKKADNGTTNGGLEYTGLSHKVFDQEDQSAFEDIDWFDPNKKNLVADGKRPLCSIRLSRSTLTSASSISPRALPVQPGENGCPLSPFWAPLSSVVR